MEPRHKNIKISVIIVNWNGKQHLEECLGSLSKLTFKGFEAILVDNGSTDGSTEFVETNFPVIKIVRLDKNEGFCRGNNIGLQHACGDFIALLNNDTLVDMNWLEELYRAMTKRDLCKTALFEVCAYLSDFCVKLKFQSSKYSIYSCGWGMRRSCFI